MLDLKPLNRILFLDIETTSQKKDFSELTENQKTIFLKKFKKEYNSNVDLKFQVFLAKKSGTSAATKKTIESQEKKIKLEVATELYNNKAPIFPEFGRVLCISIGVLWKKNEDDFYNIKVTSFADEDEKVLLDNFINHPKLGVILNKLAGKYEKKLDDFWGMCAHNGRVFDFPFIAKRMIINGFQPPAMFDYAHLKPWEQNHIIDTKEAWGYGVWDAAVSLDCLSDIFNTPSSKDDIDGSQVKDIFWVEKDLDRIVKYCEKDVLALAINYLRMKSMQDEVRLYEEPKQTQ